MDDFLASLGEATSYPQNLIYHETYEHNLRDYSDRLEEREQQLFSKDEVASVDLLEVDVGTQQNKSTTHHNVKSLQQYLGIDFSPHKSSRYVFLHAPNSRERLYTSRKLLTYLLTYHQVMPSFLDFIFPFGRQETVRELNFSGFRHESHLEPIYKSLQISEIGRSGRELQMCYSLKSVEPSSYNPIMPWSIRQTAIYHSLDVETTNALWIIVKGDELIKERIEDTLELSQKRKTLGANIKGPDAFSAALAIHMIICDWCGDNWRWYISYLEESFQEKTKYAMAVLVDTPANTSVGATPKAVTWSTISSTMSSPMQEKRPIHFNSSLKNLPSMESKQSCSFPPGLSAPFPPSARSPPTQPSSMNSQSAASSLPSKFSFGDLQKVQSVEDRANEVHLILDSNITVLSNMKDHYESIMKSDHCPENILQEASIDMARFSKRILSIINDLRMQQSRVQTLLRSVADRKTLLFGILEFQNMEASRMLATRAQESTENMEVMTKDMHILALKTKQETVSMRIITLVTLFFLPGTFISTIMSTDIIHFQADDNGNSHEVFQLGALQLFMAICIPMMCVTFAAWYGVYWYVDRKEELKKQGKSTLLEV